LIARGVESDKVYGLARFKVRKFDLLHAAGVIVSFGGKSSSGPTDLIILSDENGTRSSGYISLYRNKKKKIVNLILEERTKQCILKTKPCIAFKQ